eukprot:4313229-Prymnesium_polylepis.1
MRVHPAGAMSRVLVCDLPRKKGKKRGELLAPDLYQHHSLNPPNPLRGPHRANRPNPIPPHPSFSCDQADLHGQSLVTFAPPGLRIV